MVHSEAERVIIFEHQNRLLLFVKHLSMRILTRNKATIHQLVTKFLGTGNVRRC